MGRVRSQPSSFGGGWSWGEEVVEEGLVDCGRVVGSWEGGEPWSFPGGDKFLCCPYVLWGGSGQEGRPIGGHGSFYCFEVAVLRVPSHLEVG